GCRLCHDYSPAGAALSAAAMGALSPRKRWFARPSEGCRLKPGHAVCDRPSKGAILMKLRLLFLPALSVFLGVVAQPGPARAACTYSYQCSNYIQGNCSEHTMTSTCTPDVPANSYGAIAYGRTSRAWGSSYRWGS